jgi:hypothetical protein
MRGYHSIELRFISSPALSGRRKLAFIGQTTWKRGSTIIKKAQAREESHPGCCFFRV